MIDYSVIMKRDHSKYQDEPKSFSEVLTNGKEFSKNLYHHKISHSCIICESPLIHKPLKPSQSQEKLLTYILSYYEK